MNLAGWRLHAFGGERGRHLSVRVSGNWRLILAFEGED
ncbi:MAG: type II toxin-antitoxin system RelE/ParE family toxin [Burkholderia sp.]